MNTAWWPVQDTSYSHTALSEHCGLVGSATLKHPSIYTGAALGPPTQSGCDELDFVVSQVVSPSPELREVVPGPLDVAGPLVCWEQWHLAFPMGAPPNPVVTACAEACHPHRGPRDTAPQPQETFSLCLCFSLANTVFCMGCFETRSHYMTDLKLTL